MALRSAAVLTLVGLLACSVDPEPSPPPVEISVELPALRLPGRDLADLGDDLVIREWSGEPEEEPASDRPGEGAKRPAFVLSAPPDAPAGWVLVDGYRHGLDAGGPRLFVAGRRSDGSLGALPLIDDPELEDELCRIGAGPPTEGIEGAGRLEVRLTREGEQVRIRWGHVGARPRWELGDVKLARGRFDAPGRGPVLPALAEALRERFPTGETECATVGVEAGSGVRWVEMVRVFECAAGDPRVIFLPIWCWPTIMLVSPPVPDPEDAGPLVWNVADRIQFVNVYPDPRVESRPTCIYVRGRPYDSAEDVPMDEDDDSTIVIRADSRADWRPCRDLIARARRAGLAVALTYAEEEPELYGERHLVLPPPPAEGAQAIEVSLAPGEEEPDGAVRLVVPAGAAAGPVLLRVLDLVRRGATAIAFPE